jgi:hypothetical protein
VPAHIASRRNADVACPAAPRSVLRYPGCGSTRRMLYTARHNGLVRRSRTGAGAQAGTWLGEVAEWSIAPHSKFGFGCPFLFCSVSPGIELSEKFAETPPIVLLDTAPCYRVG